MALFVSTFALCVAAAAAGNCQLSPSNEVSFDLTNLVSMGKDLTITDGDIKNTLNEEGNNTYTFSVCGLVEKKPQVCINEKETDASCFQTDGDFASCHKCGTYVAPGEFTRIQKTNGEFEEWSKGVQLTYEGGSKCNHGGSPNRKTILQMECANQNFVKPTHALEYDHCAYTITIQSFWACPTQCPIAAPPGGKTAQLCGGHGHCGWDKTNVLPKCFCDNGWTGDACNVQGGGGSSANGTVVGLLVVTFLVVLILLGALAYLVKQIRAYRMDATNYMAIRGNELVGNQDI